MKGVTKTAIERYTRIRELETGLGEEHFGRSPTKKSP